MFSQSKNWVPAPNHCTCCLNKIWALSSNCRVWIFLFVIPSCNFPIPVSLRLKKKDRSDMTSFITYTWLTIFVARSVINLEEGIVKKVKQKFNIFISSIHVHMHAHHLNTTFIICVGIQSFYIICLKSLHVNVYVICSRKKNLNL